jgi:uncharacterized protein (TIGR02001 family)
MLKGIRNAALASAALCAMAAAASTPAQAVTVDYDFALNSAYVWRGITFTDGAVFQPSVTVGHDSGFSLNVWGNIDIDDANNLSGDHQEVDITLSYAWGSDKVSAEVGLIDYLFPHAGFGSETREVYFSVGFDVPLDPAFKIYYDFDVVEGFYGTFTIGHGGDIGDAGWSWAIGALAGFASEDYAVAYGGTDSGLYNGEINFSVSKELEFGTFGAFVAYTDTLDEDVLTEQEVDLYGGVSLSVSF